MINSVNGDGVDQLLAQISDVDLFHGVQYVGDQLAGDGVDQLLGQSLDVDLFHGVQYGGDQHAATNSIHNLQQLNSEQRTHTESEQLFLDLQKTAADKGFDIDNNWASGESVFDVLSQQLRRVKGIKNSHEQIRQELVQFLQNFPNRLHGTELFNSVYESALGSDYLESKEEDGTLNDQEILHAAANRYKAIIRVINSHGSDVMISPNDPGVVNTNPLVVGLIREKHYASLRLKRGKEEYQKNVYLLTKKEATTLTLPEIKGLKKTQQYQRGVTFFKNMKDDDVRILLENQFSPILSNKRFSCAIREGQASNQYNFDNERRVWDGQTIKRKVKGGSALYLILEDEVSLTQTPVSVTTVTPVRTTYSTENAEERIQGEQDDLNWAQVLQYMIPSTSTDTFQSGDSAFSSSEENAEERIQGEQDDLNWAQVLQDRIPSTSTDTFQSGDSAFSSSEENAEERIQGEQDDPYWAQVHETLRSVSFSEIGAEDTSLASSLTDGNQEQNEFQDRILSTSTDTFQSGDSAFSSSEETVSQNGIFSAQRTTQVMKPIRSMGKDCLSSDKRDSSGQSDSAFSSEASACPAQALNRPISLRIQDARIKPSEGPLEGGGVFRAVVDEEIPPSIETVWAKFGDKPAKASVSRDGLSLHGEEIPRGDVPGPVTVTFIGLNGELVAKGTYTYIKKKRKNSTTQEIMHLKRTIDELEKSVKRLKSESDLCDESDEFATENCHESGSDAPRHVTFNGECVTKATYTYKKRENPTTCWIAHVKRALEGVEESVKRLRSVADSCYESDEFAAENSHEAGVTQVVKAQLAEEGYLGDTETSDTEDKDSDLVDNNENEIEEGPSNDRRKIVIETTGTIKLNGNKEAEVIIKTSREYKGAATNIMTEAAGSLYGAGDLFHHLLNSTHLQEQPQEKERKEANLLRVKKWKRRRPSRSMRAQLLKRKQELANWSEKMGEMTEQFKHFQNQSLQKDDECLTLQRKFQQFSISQRQRVEQHQEVNEMRCQKASVETQLRQMEQQQLREGDRVEAQNQRLREMERQLVQREQSSYDWIISRNDVQVTGKRLGSGGWGTVYGGRYGGCAVAEKQIQKEIVSPYRLEMFQCEIDMASKCRNLCLLQFAGETVDGGFLLPVTVPMETSLLRHLFQIFLSIEEGFITLLDVALAPNYLHQKRPVSMIQRDISSANVLLWRKAGRETGIQEAQWRGKVSDFDTSKVVQQVMTETPGCLACPILRAHTTTQTAETIVFALGAFLYEVCIRECPEAYSGKQFDKMSNRALRELVHQCLQTNLDDRPDMTEIIGKLEQFQEVLRESFHIFK